MDIIKLTETVTYLDISRWTYPPPNNSPGQFFLPYYVMCDVLPFPPPPSADLQYKVTCC